MASILNLDSLPAELFLEIISHLKIVDVDRLAKTFNKRIGALCGNRLAPHIAARRNARRMISLFGLPRYRPLDIHDSIFFLDHYELCLDGSLSWMDRCIPELPHSKSDQTKDEVDAANMAIVKNKFDRLGLQLPQAFLRYMQSTLFQDFIDDVDRDRWRLWPNVIWKAQIPETTVDNESFPVSAATSTTPLDESVATSGDSVQGFLVPFQLDSYNFRVLFVEKADILRHCVLEYDYADINEDALACLYLSDTSSRSEDSSSTESEDSSSTESGDSSSTENEYSSSTESEDYDDRDNGGSTSDKISDLLDAANLSDSECSENGNRSANEGQVEPTDGSQPPTPAISGLEKEIGVSAPLRCLPAPTLVCTSFEEFLVHESMQNRSWNRLPVFESYRRESTPRNLCGFILPRHNTAAEPVIRAICKSFKSSKSTVEPFFQFIDDDTGEDELYERLMDTELGFDHDRQKLRCIYPDVTLVVDCVWASLRCFPVNGPSKPRYGRGTATARENYFLEELFIHTSAHLGLIAALDKLEVTCIALVIPGLEGTTAFYRRWYEEDRFTVIDAIGAEKDASPDRIREVLRTAARNGPEAIVVHSINWHLAPLVQAMEEELDLYIIDGIIAAVWSVVSDPKLKGWGKVLNGECKRVQEEVGNISRIPNWNDSSSD